MNNSNDTTATLLHQAAAIYADRFNFEIIPVTPRGKTPLTKNGVKDSSRNAVLLRSWWDQFPQANIGIATGDVSGLLVIDFDQPEADKALEDFEREFGELPRTPRVVAGKGGYHFYFATTESFKNHVRFRPGVDIRSTSGYIIAPPSVHENGQLYKWMPDAHIKNTPLAPLPQRIACALRSHRPAMPLESREQSTESGKLSSAPIQEGGRNDTLCRLAGGLIRSYPVDFARTMLHAVNTQHCHPPLSGTEVERIFHSVARLEVQRRRGGQ